MFENLSTTQKVLLLIVIAVVLYVLYKNSSMDGFCNIGCNYAKYERQGYEPVRSCQKGLFFDPELDEA